MVCPHVLDFVGDNECLSDWVKYQGNCYRHYTDEKTRNAAAAVCAESGATLVSLTSAEKAQKLVDYT